MQPRLGCEDFTFPKHSIDLTKSQIQSIFIPEPTINHGHPRFKTLSLNINARRGRKVIINIPIFKDTQTPDPFIDHYKHFHKESEQATKPNYIYMVRFNHSIIIKKNLKYFKFDWIWYSVNFGFNFDRFYHFPTRMQWPSVWAALACR